MTNSLVLQAGRCSYRFLCDDELLLNNLSRIFPPTIADDTTRTIELDAAVSPHNWTLSGVAADDPKILIDWILLQIYETLNGCLWLDGSTLVSSSGKSVLLTGPSHSGKTTLSLAAALSGRFKIVSEDISFFDLELRRVIPLKLPLSLREGTAERIEATTNLVVDELVFKEWIFAEEFYTSASVSIPDCVVLLDVIETDHQLPLQWEEVEVGRAIRQLLRRSNALRIPSGVEILSDVIGDSVPILLSGGNIAQRLDWLLSALK